MLAAACGLVLALASVAATPAQAAGPISEVGSSATCTATIGQNCGPYAYSNIPMSNGFDTYVSNQNVGAQQGTTQTITATDPGSWSVAADDVPYGYTGVQTFANVQQLTNDWCGSGWAGCSNPTDTPLSPLSSLSSLSVTYSESTPRDANTIAEFAPDIWGNWSNDVMFWADTQGRCDPGAYGSTVLGTAVLDGQNWTVHRYGGPGAEIIFVLDGSGGSGTCAQQTSGTIDIKAGLDWLVTNGYISNPIISQMNTGWEITSADNTTFAVSSYGINATVG